MWNAIAVLAENVLVFSKLCHGCGSCTMVCPEEAISEVPRSIGVINAGPARNGIAFYLGVLDVGEPMAVPIIRFQKKKLSSRSDQVLIIDAPPGTTCPVVESMQGTDFVLLVTEPTPFGLHDLQLTVQVAQELDLPTGVIINRDGVGDACVDVYCRDADLPVLMRIPMDLHIARGIARGKTLIDIHPEYIEQFQALYAQIVEIVEEKG